MLLTLAFAAMVYPQEGLTLRDAARQSLEKHPAIQEAAGQADAAGHRVTQARAGYLPKVNYAESWARSDNPVFVFSSLLSQHQFTEANFRIGPLNRPDFLNNFQSQVSVEQNVYDGGATRALVRSAALGQEAAREQERRTRMELIARVVRAYSGALLAEASLNAAREAVKSAEADVARAESFRNSGMTTDADVLSIRVHLAAVREQEIRRSFDLQVARAALAEAADLAPDATQVLSTALVPVPLPESAVEPYEKLAAENRPELKQSALMARIAASGLQAAQAALKPQVGLRGAFEANRQDFVRQGGANWLIAASVRWNLFNGYADRARIAEARAAGRTAEAQRLQATRGVRLEVVRAWADARASQERLLVADAAVAQAEESLRIIRNRYEGGLTTVTELLRNETALLEARTRRIAAIHDQRVAAAWLELATGTLSLDSEVLK
jgi:outer membrane protein